MYRQKADEVAQVTAIPDRPAGPFRNLPAGLTISHAREHDDVLVRSNARILNDFLDIRLCQLQLLLALPGAGRAVVVGAAVVNTVLFLTLPSIARRVHKPGRNTRHQPQAHQQSVKEVLKPLPAHPARRKQARRHHVSYSASRDTVNWQSGDRFHRAAITSSRLRLIFTPRYPHRREGRVQRSAWPGEPALRRTKGRRPADAQNARICAKPSASNPRTTDVHNGRSARSPGQRLSLSVTLSIGVSSRLTFFPALVGLICWRAVAVKLRLLSGSIKRRHGRIVLKLAHGMRHDRTVNMSRRAYILEGLIDQREAVAEVNCIPNAEQLEIKRSRSQVTK